MAGLTLEQLQKMGAKPVASSGGGKTLGQLQAMGAVVPQGGAIKRPVQPSSDAATRFQQGLQTSPFDPVLKWGGNVVSGAAKALATPFTRTAGTIVAGGAALGGNAPTQEETDAMGMFKPYGTPMEAAGGAMQAGAEVVAAPIMAMGAALGAPAAVTGMTALGTAGLFHGLGKGLETSGAQKKDVLGTVKEVSTQGAIEGALGELSGYGTGLFTDWWKGPRTAPPVKAGAVDEGPIPPGHDDYSPITDKGAKADALAYDKQLEAMKGAKPPTAPVDAKVPPSVESYNAGLGDIAKNKLQAAEETLKAVPGRIQTNAKAAAEETALMARQTPVVREAVTNGVSLKDAKITEGLDEPTKGVARKMVDSADLIAQGEETATPNAIAGGEVQKRIGMAESIRKEVGTKLGEIAQDIKGEVVNVKAKVLQRLQEVRGLEGLRIDNTGALDFSKTDLTLSAQEAERNAINGYFQDLSGRDAYGLHTFRQAIFDFLGGRKKVLQAPTDMEESAMDAMRKGAADAIETVSPEYKDLNQAYALIMEPLKNLRKLYRGLEGASDDILDEASGNFMQRLTGASKGSMELMKNLDLLDTRLTEFGVPPDTNLLQLQKFNDILKTYYTETVAPGSFAGGIATGVRKGLGGVLDAGVKLATGSMSQTDAVRRAAIKALLGL